MRRNTAYLIFLLLTLSACFNLNKLSLYDLSGQYENTLFTSLETTAVNQGDNATVYVPLRMVDFLPLMDDSSGRAYTKIRIHHELFSSYEAKQVLDSASLIYIDSTLSLLDTTFMLSVKYPYKGVFVVKIGVSDLNRPDEVNDYLILDNSVQGSRNDFIATNEDQEILYHNYVSDEEVFSLEYSGNTDKLFVKHYKRDFPLALPPFIESSESSFDLIPDSIFEVGLTNRKTPLLHLQEEGFYYFQADTNFSAGFSMFRFPKGFPNISTPDQMFGPMRYITTKKEFEAIEQSPDLKLAIDNYWLNNAGSPTRARAMIQKYYGRVGEANTYFSSYHEGWKTDRGLIYIVYGPPVEVYRADGIEDWLYGEKGNANSMRFRFVNIENPYSENDYNLIKSSSYKEKWYNIVNTWRR